MLWCADLVSNMFCLNEEVFPTLDCAHVLHHEFIIDIDAPCTVALRDI